MGCKGASSMLTANQIVSESWRSEQIRSTSRPNCCICGVQGKPLYQALEDRLFRAPGKWNLRKCPTETCGLIWLDPMPVEDDLPKAYRSYHTHHGSVPQNGSSVVRDIYFRMQQAYLRSRYNYVSERGNKWDRCLGIALGAYPPRRAIYDSLVFWLNFKAGGQLLEIGCGNGSALKFMKELGWQVEGVDFDPLAVEQARGHGLKVHLGSLEAQVFPDGQFDAVVARHVIEHVYDPARVLRECYRVLKPGGVLVLITPNADSWGHRRYLQNWRGLEPPRHLHIFNRTSLSELCSRAGFRVAQCRAIVLSRSILTESSTLRDVAGSRQRSQFFRTRLGSELQASWQWARSLFDPDAGEETLVVSIK